MTTTSPRTRSCLAPSPIATQHLPVATIGDLGKAAGGVSFDHAWLDPVSGKAFCLATGPSREAVIRIHARAGHPASEVYELPIAV